MENVVVIKDKDSLLLAADYLHDSGFKMEDIIYSPEGKTFTMRAKEYVCHNVFFVSWKTDIVKNQFELNLDGVESCEIKERDRKGYEAVQEDYFNELKVGDDDSILIKMTFHEVKLNLSRFAGLLLGERKSGSDHD